MTADLAAAIQHVQGELADLIECLDGPGAAYARKYTASIFNGTGCPPAPAALSPAAAGLIRDIALDQSAFTRGRSKARRVAA